MKPMEMRRIDNMWRRATEEWILTELERRGFDVQAACEIIGSSSILVQVAPEFIDELNIYGAHG